ncbi:PREDICTED: chymotrypsin-2-like [Dinoponera quadriceps]|uniref:Chymotrypsin-2-like n=1 Tax=Dinoponera quadriceps TaxID=609295 RepID=A0A6P3XBK7_DINQU|nr:PREDICTED: chymotrypsin-2-like [Dinoponera quadriceps]
MASYMTALVCILTIALANIVCGYWMDKTLDIKEEWNVGGLINANPTDTEKYPFMVSIKSEGTHICSGAMLTQVYVITNARCLEMWQESSSAKNLTVVTGSSILQCGGKAYNVDKIFFHDEYAKNTDYVGDYMHNIALIRVEKIMEYNSLQWPVKLPNCKDPPPSCERAENVDWGMLYKDGPVSNNLQVSYPFQSDRWKCQGDYYETIKIAPGDFCLFTGVKVGTCHGSFGGSVMCKNYLIGITSGVTSCYLELPLIATDICSHYKWIERIIAN